MTTNYIDEILKELEQVFFAGIPKEEMGTNQVDQQELEDWLKQKLQQVAQQERERITKLIKTVGATGTENEVDKLIDMIND